jgi:hypothetical protein
MPKHAEWSETKTGQLRARQARAVEAARRQIAGGERPTYHVKSAVDDAGYEVWIPELPGVWTVTTSRKGVEAAARMRVAVELGVPDDAFDLELGSATDGVDALSEAPAAEEARRLSEVSTLLLDKIAALRQLEAESRNVPVGSPEFKRLSAEIEARSREVFGLTTEQRSLAERTPPQGRTIEEIGRQGVR